MYKTREDVQTLLEWVTQVIKQNYDWKRSTTDDYQPSNKVILEATNLTTDCLMKKLDNKHFRPFIIKKKVSASVYKLQLLATWKHIHPVFNEVLLS